MGNSYQGRQLLLIHKHNVEVSVWNDNASMYKLSITKHMHYDSFSKIWI